MANQPPRRTRIDSPEINSIDRTTQRISNWLHNDFREVIKPLQVLPSLPGILTEVQERLVEQFKMHFSGQVAVEMKSREANITMADRMSQFLAEQVTRKRNLLSEYSNRTKYRYGRMAEEAAQEHEAFLQQLDSHAYRISDDIYPNQIQAKFSYIPEVSLDLLARNAMESAVARTASLSQARGKASDALREFLSVRRRAYEEIRDFDSGLEQGHYEISYCYAVFEDFETGEEVVEAVFFRDGIPWSPGEYLLERLKDEVRQTIESGTGVSPSLDELSSALETTRVELGVPPEQVSRFKKDYASLVE